MAYIALCIKIYYFNYKVTWGLTTYVKMVHVHVYACLNLSDVFFLPDEYRHNVDRVQTETELERLQRLPVLRENYAIARSIG